MKDLFLVFAVMALFICALAEKCFAEPGYVTIENNLNIQVKVVISWRGSRDLVTLTPGTKHSVPVKKMMLQTIETFSISNNEEILLKRYTASADCDEVYYINISFSDENIAIDCSRICYWTYSFPVHKRFGSCEAKCP